jgi:2-oxo-3-hexenedioate decarboxylase
LYGRPAVPVGGTAGGANHGRERETSVMALSKWARHLVDAERDRREVDPFAAKHKVSVEAAYAIQDEIVNYKIANGDRLIGMKLGLTSKIKQQVMNVDEPGYGQLLASTLLPVEEPLSMASCIHPRVEPEIVFYLGEDLQGPGVTARDVLDATAAIGTGLEVIDSRFKAFNFTLADVAADNTSACKFVLGPERVHPDEIPNLAHIGCVLHHNGDPVATASGAAILGHPAEAVALLANWMYRYGYCLEAGSIILSGGMTNAVPLAVGDYVRADFGSLGSVGVRVTA